MLSKNTFNNTGEKHIIIHFMGLPVVFFSKINNKIECVIMQFDAYFLSIPYSIKLISRNVDNSTSWETCKYNST